MTQELNKKERELIQKVKVEFLAEDVERSTEKETEIDRAYARGWNKCQHTILNNISEVFRKDRNASCQAESKERYEQSKSM